ncbi:hypothetical protein PROFUN_12635 [Planoprotostelium fungivorum]|uniref:IPT/TIG domain-containing protein n=1 Tax=Planoprotostelium fungivorum TaxID=1890364 RepID=A0A2P6N755_9EUKA|nr:hypothetical protein PROFUN_12635 [Planoprotostelium fungivorum]
MRLDFDLFEGEWLYTKVYRNVTDLLGLRASLGGDVAFLDAGMIHHGFQLAIAANRALHTEKHGGRTTKNLHSELIFTLSGSRNITHSLNTFGIAETATEAPTLLIAIFSPSEQKVRDIESQVRGEEEKIPESLLDYDFSGIKRENDIKKVKMKKEETRSEQTQAYKITEKEGDVLKAICGSETRDRDQGEEYTSTSKMEVEEGTNGQSVGSIGVEGQLWELLCCLHSIGKELPELLVQVTTLVAPSLHQDKIVPILGKMFEEIPLMLQQQTFKNNPQILKDPPPPYITVRLLLGFRDLQALLHRCSILQLLHLTNNIIPPNTSQQQIDFLLRAQQIFQSWTTDRLHRLHSVLSETPLHMERQQLLQLEPTIPWEMLHFAIELIKLPWEELSSFRTWFSSLPKRHSAVLVNVLQIEPSLLLELKQRLDAIAPPSLSVDEELVVAGSDNEFSEFDPDAPPAVPASSVWDSSLIANPPSQKAPGITVPMEVGGQYQLRIARQPPSRTVYQRILKPFPSVMLVGGASDAVNNNLFVEASLMRSDSDVELPTCIEGNRIVRISNGVFAVFKKLKILSTSQQQGTLFRLKFTLKKYVGNVFEQIATAVTVTNPIEVFSHTLYLSERPEVAPAPPIIHEILPTMGGSGTRAVVLGINFVNNPNLKVRFGDHEVPNTFHEQGTLVITVPTLPKSGSLPVRVSNDGTNYCETKVFFTFMPS